MHDGLQLTKQSKIARTVASILAYPLQWLIDICVEKVLQDLGHVADIADIAPDDEEIIIGDGTIWTGEQFDAVLARYPRYVARGNLAAWDYTLLDFTTDGTWRELDLSGIVPPGAVAVDIKCGVVDNFVAKGAYFCQAGLTDRVAGPALITQIAHLIIYMNATIGLDGDRKIQYFFSNTVWTQIYFAVSGWWL